MASEPRNYQYNRITGRHSLPYTIASSVTTTGAVTSSVQPLGSGYTVFSMQHKRATTSATLESTSVKWKVQGSLDSTSWFTIGAATRVTNSTSWVLLAVTSTAPISHVRASINGFTTSVGAATTAENRITFNAKILPVS